MYIKYIKLFIVNINYASIEMFVNGNGMFTYNRNMNIWLVNDLYQIISYASY